MTYCKGAPVTEGNCHYSSGPNTVCVLISAKKVMAKWNKAYHEKSKKKLELLKFLKNKEILPLF